MACTMVKLPTFRRNILPSYLESEGKPGRQRAWSAMSFAGVHLSEDLHYGLGYDTV
jgi:hypothetical protein